jgi:dTDP-4-amino-4,6-dideoxygalactose transaminase
MRDMKIMDVSGKNIVLFHPHVPKKANEYVNDTLNSRWIGQGPKVDLFEKKFVELFGGLNAVAVNSGTSALHLAYSLENIKDNDEVLCPVFTCTATNIPFLYSRSKLIFVDIEEDSLNISLDDLESKITEKTKLISLVHYGGLPCNLEKIREISEKYNIPVVQDAAHALGASFHGKKIADWSKYSTFSFQAIKTITTGDGGMLTINTIEDRYLESAKRVRWFGIDRSKKQQGIWENDITEIGYKYQMTDISASLGLAALDEFDMIISKRRNLLLAYQKHLSGSIDGLKYYSGKADSSDYEHGAWLCTIRVKDRLKLQKKLYSYGIETNQVHYRNDRYSIFKNAEAKNLKNMDDIEDEYLVLPLHTKMDINHVEKICDVIKSGW